jgi:O-antigen ligase
MELLQACVIAAVALILLPGYSFSFDVIPKIVVLLAGTGVMLVTYVSTVNRRGVGVVRPVFPALLFLSFVSLAVSTAASKHPAFSLFGTTWRYFGAVTQTAILLFIWFVARACAGRADRVRTILRGVTLAGLMSAAYGIAQYAGWDPLLPAAGYHIGEGAWTIVRPPGTLGYASYFATWLAFVIFLGIAQYEREESRWWRRAAVAACSLAAAALWFTGTRAAIVALAAGAIVWVVIKRPKISRRAIEAAALVVVAGVGFYYSPPGLQLRSRTRWFVEDPWGGARRYLWRDSFLMASKRLGAGYGPEVFTSEFPRFESVDLAMSYPDYSHESPHNIFIDSLISQGVFGLVILLGLCTYGFWTAWRLRAAPVAAALAAGVVSQQFTAFTTPTALVFFVTLGLVAALDARREEQRYWIEQAGRPVLLVAACLLVYFAVRLAAADHALALAERGLDRGDLAEAGQQYQRYERYRLPGGGADLWYSRRMLNLAIASRNPAIRMGALLQAETAAEKATRTPDDPFDSWYNLAVIAGLHDNGGRAEQCLRMAIAANPNWFKPHWMLAQVLKAEGRVLEAGQEAALAVRLSGGKHREVIETSALTLQK